MDSLKKQLSEVSIELVRSKHDFMDCKQRLDSQKAELDRYRGIGVEAYTMSECEDIERKMKSTLDLVAQRKVMIFVSHDFFIIKLNIY